MHEKFKQKWEERLDFFPLFFILALFPWIVVRTDVRTYTEAVPFLPERYYSSDFFLYGKLVALYISTAFMFLRMGHMRFPKTRLCRLMIKGWKKKETFLFLYLFLLFLSSLLAEHKVTAFRGVADNLQGFFTVFCYVTVFFYGRMWSRKYPDKISWLAGTIAVMTAAAGVIGISQFAGVDLLSNGPVRWFLGGRDAVVKNVVYLAQYHWNYAGSFAAFFLPVILAGILYYRKCQSAGEKSARRKKMAAVVLFYMLVLCLAGSQSRTGGLAAVFTSFTAFVIFRGKIKELWKFLIILAVSSLILAGICNYRITGSVTGRWQEISYHSHGGKKLSYMITGSECTEIGFGGGTFYMKICRTGEKIYPEITDEKGTRIVLRREEPVWVSPDERLSGLSFFRDSEKNEGQSIYGICVKYKKKSYFITNQYGDHTYYYRNSYGRYDKMIKAQMALPSGFHEFASLRGYAWSGTLPLLKNTWLTGAGADQFLFVFPEQDYVARNKYDLGNTYYTKPHNWYLQMAVESGCLSLAFMLVFFIRYLGQWKGYFSEKVSRMTDGKGVFTGAVFFSVAIWLFVSFFTDSFLTTAPLFWGITGIADGYICQKKT